MGCFDVSCGISSITIKSGDDALVLLLIPQTNYPQSITLLDKKVEIEPGLQQVFNEGPLGMYMPFCLPIRGKYNDYGSLEDIVQDETVKAVEKYFGMKIEQLFSIIHRGKYGTIFDEEVLSVYSDGLKVSAYSEGKITEAWLKEAGFTKNKEGQWIHKDTKSLRKWTGKEWVDLNIPRNHVVFKIPKNSSHYKDPVPHIISYKSKDMNEHGPVQEIWATNTKEFCERFYEASGVPSFGSDKGGIAIGIKKDFVEKAKLARKLSGMFIDGMFYDSLTKGMQTNEYAKENGGILDIYPNRFMMDKLGFKFVRCANKENIEVEVPLPEGTIGYKHEKLHFVYSHDLAPGMLFSNGLDTNFGCIEFYRKNKKDKWEEVKTWKGGNSKSYSNFSANNVAEFFKAETGNVLDLTELSKMTTTDITLLKIQDHLKRKGKNAELIKALRAKLDKFPKEDNSKEKMDIFHELWGIEDRSESREADGRLLGYFNFPLVYEFYTKSFAKPSDKFKETITKFKTFLGSLWGINRPLMPSAHFGQHGDYINQVAFGKIVLEVAKGKMLGGYGKEFSTKEDMFETIKLIYGDDYYEHPEKRKRKNDDDATETVYMHKGEEVAVWREYKDNMTYGYLITEKGF